MSNVPVLSVNNLAEFNPKDNWKFKLTERWDKCCICGKLIDPLERDKDGQPVRDQGGMPIISNHGHVGGIGARCSSCRIRLQPAFVLGRNIRNIRPNLKGGCEFDTFIDDKWVACSWYPVPANQLRWTTADCGFTNEAIYMPLPGKHEEKKRAIVIITGKELSELMAEEKKTA